MQSIAHDWTMMNTPVVIVQNDYYAQTARTRFTLSLYNIYHKLAALFIRAFT